jgi:Rrf2 family protein
MKLSKLTDYAVVILSALHYMEVDGVPMASASVLAKQSCISEPTVSKVLKILTRHNLLNAQRGAQGGYSLASPLDQISVLQVIEAIEGRVSMVDCVTVSTSNAKASDDASCALESVCALNGRWGKVNVAVTKALSGISVATLMLENNALKTMTRKTAKG